MILMMPGARWGVAAVLLVGIHPLRVETLAWASCFPFHIAMLFSLLEDARLQPTELIARVLGEIDNSTVVLATLSDGGSG